MVGASSKAGKTLLTYHGTSQSVSAVAWSVGGYRIAFEGGNGTVEVWDATTGTRIITYHGHSGPVRAIAWSFAGTWIASGGDDETVQVWQASYS